jgi:hypothetical protein
LGEAEVLAALLAAPVRPAKPGDAEAGLSQPGLDVRRAERLIQTGAMDEAEALIRQSLLTCEKDTSDRAEQLAAIARGKIADIHDECGEYDEALRIRREEELPIHERLGAIRARHDHGPDHRYSF